jgi:hypothetical protein
MTILSTNQSLNQFTQKKSRGFVVADGGIRSVEGILNNDDVTQITSAGDLVALVPDDNNTGVRNFAEVITADAVPYGFVKKNLKQTQYKSGDFISVSRNYDIITEVAAVDVVGGETLYYIPTGADAGKLTNEADDNVKVGIAINGANAGGLVDLEIRLDYIVVTPTPAP